MTPLDQLLAARCGRISDAEIGRRTGVDRDVLRRTRCGERVPRHATIQRLARGLNIPADDLADAVLKTVAAARREKAPS